MPSVTLKRVGDEAFTFDSPTCVASIPGVKDWLIITMQRGEIWCANPKTGEKKMFLDFRRKMQGIILFEEGLHGIVFHPQFAYNGQFYLRYTQNEPRRSVLSEMAVRPGYVKGGPMEAEPSTERILMEVPQILAEHWGGNMVFDPEGLLYVGLGDGGLRGDLYRLAQNPYDLHGKILRIDVDHRSGSLPYAIPASNPFAKNQLWRPEIYALGLRNPWGLAFDKETGLLWCADVGQDFWEEINVIHSGANYGWSDRDGPWPLANHAGAHHLAEEAPKFTEAVHAYSRIRNEGLCIIGGFVYHGTALPQLKGHYLFADWAFGRVFSLEVEAAKNKESQPLPKCRYRLYDRAETQSLNPTVVAPDSDGEPLILSQNGHVFYITAKP
jgi:glucose/arabinose dehydrogenase